MISPLPALPPADQLLASLTPIILEAGRLIEEIKARGYHKRQKADHSPVTDADEAAERLLTTAIRKIDPSSPIIGEEAAAAGTAGRCAQRYWLLDPIDGTVAFIHGGKDYSVNIGLVENGYPVLGLVYHSPSGTLWKGARGMGAYHCDKNGRERPITTRPYATPPTIAVSHSSLGPLTSGWISHIKDAHVIKRGASLKICMLAEGAADLYPRHGHTHEWDTAAGDAILRAAGGILLGKGMQPLVYGQPSFSNPPFLVVGDPSIIPSLPPFPEAAP